MVYPFLKNCSSSFSVYHSCYVLCLNLVQRQVSYFGHSPSSWLLSSQLIAMFFATSYRQEHWPTRRFCFFQLRYNSSTHKPLNTWKNSRYVAPPAVTFGCSLFSHTLYLWLSHDSQTSAVIFLNTINRMSFVSEVQCVFLKVGTEFLLWLRRNLGLKELNGERLRWTTCAGSRPDLFREDWTMFSYVICVTEIEVQW